MRRFFVGIRMCLLIFGCLATRPADPQENQNQAAVEESFKIRVDVDLVTTDVTVLGNPVSPLRGEDFIIYDNNVAQPVSHFSLDQYPLAVAILIDGSLTETAYLPILQTAAASALRRLKPEDQVVLYSFNTKIRRLTDLTKDRLQIAGKIGTIQVALGTNIYGTIEDASHYLKKHAPRRRRAIILISDNCHIMGTRNAKICEVELLESSTTLYNIVTPGQWGDLPVTTMPGCQEPDKAVRRLAAESGGEVLDVQKPASMLDVLEKVINTLRMQYTLGFNPAAPGDKGSFHRLAVKLASSDRCPGCRLLARSGYYSGVAAPPAPLDKSGTEARYSPEKTDELLIQQTMANAGSIEVDLPGIPFKVEMSQQANSGREPKIKVDLQIAFKGIVFKSVEDKHACKLRVAVFYADGKKKILGSQWRTIEGQLSPETYSRVIASGIEFSTLIPLKTENQILKIVVYDEQSGKIGSKLVPLQ